MGKWQWVSFKEELCGTMNERKRNAQIKIKIRPALMTNRKFLLYSFFIYKFSFRHTLLRLMMNSKERLTARPFATKKCSSRVNCLTVDINLARSEIDLLSVSREF